MMQKLRGLLHTVLYVSVCLVGIDNAWAQRSVSGKVTSIKDGSSLPGVNVVLKGTSIGTMTDADGQYTLEVADQEVLVFSYIGYKTTEVPIGSRSVIDFQMVEDAEQLEEVVVTALGVEREKKSVGYAMQSVDAEDVNDRQEINVMDALKGRVAGLQIKNANGGVGGTTTIVIRGGSNLSLDRSNQPLIVVDGVPIVNDDTNLENSGRDWGSGINAINPDDIESMQVLKGANAAALYGSRGANGVILITTKKGKRNGGGIGVTYGFSRRIQKVYQGRDVQNKFGIGYNGWKKKDAFGKDKNGNLIPPSVNYYGSGASWGPRMDGTPVKWYDGKIRPFSPQPNNILEPWETGITNVHNVAISGANERGSMRVSITDLKATSMQPNSKFDRLNLSLNSTVNLTEKINATVTLNYSEVTNLNPLSSGNDDGAFGKATLYNWARSEKVALRKKLYKKPDGTRGFTGGRGGGLIWTMMEADYTNKYSRYIGSVTINWTITDWLSVMGRSGIDNNNGRYTGIWRASNLARNNGDYRTGLNRDDIRTNEFLLMFNKNIIEDLSFGINIGGSTYSDSRYKLLSDNYAGQANPGLYAIANNDGDKYNPSETFYAKKQRSLYGTLDFGYKGFLFLQITGRNDWTSTLPINANSYFYPSVSSSFVFSEVVKLPSWMSFGKIRSSYAQASTDDTPYQLQPTYSIGEHHSLSYANTSDVIPPTNLKPQHTFSFEAGLELGFFDSRLNVTFDYYNRTSEEQILSGRVPWSSGFKNKKFNSGSITNSGIELLINAVPVIVGDFKIETILTLAKNNNVINNLDDDGGVKVYHLRSGILGETIVAEKGKPYGSIQGSDFIYDKETGKPLVRENGTPYTTSERVTLGNITPDMTGGLTTTFTYKNLTLNTIIHAQFGGDMWFGSKLVGDLYGQSISSLQGRDKEHGGLEWTDSRGRKRDDGRIFKGLVVKDLKYNKDTKTYTYTKVVENEKIISAVLYGFRTNPHSSAVYDNTWIRLTELSLSYNIPNKYLSRLFIQNLSLGVFTRNLAYLYKNAPDNINPLGDISPGRIGGREFGSAPISRVFGFSAKVSF